MRTLRAELKLLCRDAGQAMRWNAALAQEWIARRNATELYFYCDGHVRVYHGDQTAVAVPLSSPRAVMPASQDRYWINATDGVPLREQGSGPRPIATLKKDVIPWLEGNVAKTPAQERRLAEDARELTGPPSCSRVVSMGRFAVLAVPSIDGQHGYLLGLVVPFCTSFGEKVRKLLKTFWR